MTAMPNNAIMPSQRLKTWMLDDALPFWADHGTRDGLGFCERLNLCGKPVTDIEHRVRVQARQTYVYAHAAYLGWYEHAHIVSDLGWNFLNSHGAGEGKNPSVVGISYTLDSLGRLKSDYKETYGQAFFLLAAAWRWRAFKDIQALKAMANIKRFLINELRSSDGGWHEGLPWSWPQRQNTHMHLFEAFLTSFEATGETDFLELADEIYVLFIEKMLCSETAQLREFFTTSWKPDPEKGHLIQPGHMMEWCWLLRWYDRLKGGDNSEFITRIYDAALALGRNQKTGWLFDEVTPDGTAVKATSRLWAVTEYIKATLIMSELQGSYWVKQAQLLTEQLFNTYLATERAGGWLDTLDHEGEFLTGYWEASTFYHLMGLVAEWDRFDVSL